MNQVGGLSENQGEVNREGGVEANEIFLSQDFSVWHFVVYPLGIDSVRPNTTEIFHS
jgi:hypothetical protein